MESEVVVTEQIPKKGRHRKKQLYNSIMHQIEFYFSDSNITKDKFLLPLIQNDPFVDISILLKFNKLRKLTTNIDDVVKAINNSQLLELSEDKTKIKRKTEVYLKDNVDNCTLYVERIKVDATHDWLTSIFSEFGNVTYVSIPKYKHNKVNKGFAFVEYENENEATEALNFFESISCKMSSLIPAENLCSIITYEGNNTNNIPTKDTKDEMKNSDENVQKKRKHSTEESENLKKKIKTDNTTDTDNIESVQGDDSEEKKKKKQRKMRRKIFKELGLQVLSRAEWKKIRNRYLDNQRAKMTQLKQFLNKKKFTNHSEMKHKIENKNAENQIKEVEQDEPVEKLPFTPGVIVKTLLPNSYPEGKAVKEELQQYSTGIKYVDLSPTDSGSDVYIRFSDNDNAKQFCSSDYKGETVILQGKEEEEYWNKINNNRSLKLKKNKKNLRGREKLLKKAEKVLGKHIKFDDAD